ncbi:alkyl hydroperoxide reductase subunit F [Pigmentiphaga litoralis]|uniref:alkyl hydroperoxide reductase subunit F n=1 Tax=Pigmentiphaga litoralis TaxID=516702 RepID=UPI003B434EDF
MLDSTIKAQLKAYLERLPGPIELVAALDDGASSTEMRGLLEDILDCSPQVSLREDVSGARVPSFAITRPGQAPRVRFAGLPLGHEFTSLVLALLQVGGYPPKVEESVLANVRDLAGPLNFEVYMSLSCHNCPDVVQALNLMAAVNPDVNVTTIDGALFQSEVAEREIMAVPSVYLNGQPFASGRMTVEEFVAKLDTNREAKDAARLAAQKPFDVLVVGGGPAGAGAAVYAARKGIRTGIVADRFGGQTNDTLGIENYISVKETTGPKFAADLLEHVKQYGVDVMNLQRVAKIIPANEPGDMIGVQLENGAVLQSRSVVLATGARWRNLNVPGEEEYKNKGVAYCPHCDGPLFKGKRVAVVGGGNSGVEAAIDLAGIVAHVTLIEFGEQLRADAVLVSKARSLPNVTILTRAKTTEVEGKDGVVSALHYEDMATDTKHRIELEGVFVQIGLIPNTDFLKGVVTLSRFGEIEVDAKGHTNLPGVFAAGDATTTPYKQIVVAAGEGSKAALSAFDYLIRSSVAEAA